MLATLFCSIWSVFVWLVGSWIIISMNASWKFSFHVEYVFTIFPTMQLSQKASYCFINVKWWAIYFFGTSPSSVQEIDACVDRDRRKTRASPAKSTWYWNGLVCSTTQMSVAYEWFIFRASAYITWWYYSRTSYNHVGRFLNVFRFDFVSSSC